MPGGVSILLERGDLRFRRLETAEASNASNAERITRLEAGALWAQHEMRIIELAKRVFDKQA